MSKMKKSPAAKASRCPLRADWMLAVDLDGNLDREDEACRVLLHALRADGLRRVAIATAHPKHGIRVRHLGAFYEVDYLILENGSIVLKREGQGWRDLEAWHTRHKARRAGVEALRSEMLRRTTTAEMLNVNYSDPPTDMRIIRIPGGDSPVRFEGCFGSFQLFSNDPAAFRHAVSFSRDLVRKTGVEVCEIMDVTSLTYGVGSKGDGVAFVAGLDSDPLPTVAMGDSTNDVSMLSTCGLPCAPANAQPEIKALIRDRKGIQATRERIEAVKEVLRRIAEERTAAG